MVAELDFNNEKWIPGQEGRYSITKEGDVFSYVKRYKYKLKLYKKPTNSKGKGTDNLYYSITLYSKGSSKYSKPLWVHRLVAEAFIEKQEEGLIVNHKDGNKSNNHVSNLEWVTYSENTRHAVAIGLWEAQSSQKEQTTHDIEQALCNPYKSLSSYKNKLIPDETLVSNGVPSELKGISRRSGSILWTWNYFCDIFTLCDSSLSNKEISNITKMSSSAICYIRNGRRLSKARIVYDKYKEDANFFINYSPVFNYCNSLKLKYMECS